MCRLLIKFVENALLDENVDFGSKLLIISILSKILNEYRCCAKMMDNVSFGLKLMKISILAQHCGKCWFLSKFRYLVKTQEDFDFRSKFLECRFQVKIAINANSRSKLPIMSNQGQNIRKRRFSVKIDKIVDFRCKQPQIQIFG